MAACTPLAISKALEPGSWKTPSRPLASPSCLPTDE